MKIQEIHHKKTHKIIIRRAFDIFCINKLPDGAAGLDEIVNMIPPLLKKAPKPIGAVDASLRRGQYLTAVGVLYGMAIESAFDWILCETRFDRESKDNGVISVVSPDHAYFIYPIGEIYGEVRSHGGETLTLYEKIKSGDLPEVPSGAFLDLGKYMKNPDEALREIEPRVRKGNGPDTFNEAYSEEVYKTFVRKWGEELPEDYLAFLKSGAGLPNPENAFFWVVKDDWGSSVDSMFTMRDNHGAGSLFQVFDWQGMSLIPRMLPIGGDGSFGYILMSFREREIGAVYYCTTYSERGALREGGEYHEGQGYWQIAGSFPDFLHNLMENPDG